MSVVLGLSINNKQLWNTPYIVEKGHVDSSSLGFSLSSPRQSYDKRKDGNGVVPCDRASCAIFAFYKTLSRLTQRVVFYQSGIHCNGNVFGGLGDHLNTCTTHSGAKKTHDWMVDQVGDFFRTTHKVKTQSLRWLKAEVSIVETLS